MAWASSNRRAELPKDWAKIRARVLKRDRHVCQLSGPYCTQVATEVDHAGDKHDHRDEMLRAVCHTCHAERTRAQAQAATKPALSNKRKVERHPGLR